MSLLSRTALVATLLAVPLLVELRAAPQSPAVTKLLDEARQALGGRESAAAIRTFKLKGTIKTTRGNEPGTFEIFCGLPEKFIQIEQRTSLSAGQTVREPTSGPSVERRTTRLGFNGDALIFQPPAYDPSTRFSVLPLTQPQFQAAMKGARTGFANLTLALFAESFAGVPLQFTEAAGPESDHSVQVDGTDVTGILTFNRQTKLPERFGRMRYGDYRDVGGRKVPFHISNNLDVWIVREFLINLDVADKVFKPTDRSAPGRSIH